MRSGFKYLILFSLIFTLSFQVQAQSEKRGGVSRRSFLAMFGGAIGAAAIGPKITLLADKVLTSRFNEAQELMRINSSLDFDFIRRSAWERYFTGKVTVNPTSALGNELEMLQNYRTQLAKFMSHPSVSPESKQLAQVLFRNTNDFYPFDISPREYVERAKEYFERARAETSIEIKSGLAEENAEQKIRDSFQEVYEKIRSEYENGEAEMSVRTSLCRQYLR